MSTCLPDTSIGTNQPFAASWRSGTGLVPHQTLGRILQRLVAWRTQQRYRRDLRRLPDYLLRDIGLDVDEARQESRRPFWQV